MNGRMSLVVVLVGGLVTVLPPREPVYAWGFHGHEISARAAVLALPSEMPAFFRNAIDHLAYLGGEPDRWRDPLETDLETALAGATGPEHFLNLESVPPGGLESDDRYAFIRSVEDGRLPGLSSYRMLELFQRVRLEFRLWRVEDDPEVRAWIEQRIINDAGILGHYVTDAANPLHTTVHFDGWVGDNPEGFAVGRGIHARFESEYVQARIGLGDLMARLGPARPVRVWDDPRSEILAHIEEAHDRVEALYRLDRDVPFSEATLDGSHHEFVVDRLTAGALVLRDAWWTAWVSSGR